MHSPGWLITSVSCG